MNKITLAMLAAFVLPAVAHAQEADGPTVSVSLTGATNYEWRGVSQSANHAAVFAAVNVGYKGFCAGTGTENVDFAGIKQEYDFWGGYALPLGKNVKLDVGFVRYGYVDAPTNIDTFEVKGALSGTIGKLGLTGAVYHTGNYFGSGNNATYYEAQASLPVVDKVTLSGAFGHQKVNNAFNYNNWRIGASYALAKNASVSVKYHDTDDNGALFGRLGKSQLVGSFTVSF